MSRTNRLTETEEMQIVRETADDSGVGMSTLNKWIRAHRDTDVVSWEDLSLAQENDRLQRENRIHKEEREILKWPRCSPPARLMRQNGISVVRNRKHKATADSDHKFNIAPNLLDRNFISDQPNQK